MKRIPLLILSLILLCANSCGVYRKYPGDLEHREKDSTTIAAKAWREFFTDPCLQTLIDSALVKNTDLNIARLQVEEAQALLQGANLAYFPSIGLDAKTSLKTFNIGAHLSWDVDIFGSLTNEKRGAEAKKIETEAYKQAVQTALIATIAENYYTLLMLDEQLVVSKETLANWDVTISTMETLALNGKTNDVAVLQARANRNGLEASILTIQEHIKLTESSLSALLKQPSSRIKRGRLDRQRFPKKMTTGVPAYVLANRPDVRQAEAALAEAFYVTNEAQSAFYPQLNLTGSLGWTNLKGQTIVDPAIWVSSIVASLSAPLFNKGRNMANLKVARARQQEAALHFEQCLIDAGREVNDALLQWQTSDKLISLDEKQITDLGAATEKTWVRVQNSDANYLEFLTARQSLLRARLTLVQDRVDRIMAVIALYHALGGGAE